MNAQQVNAQFEALFNAVKARNAAIESKDNIVTMSYMVKAENEKSIKAGMKHIKNDTFTRFVESQSTEKKGAVNFTAVKVNVKILHFLSALGEKNANLIDAYSAAIINNTFSNDNMLSAKSAMITLCKNLEYDALDTVQRIKSRCRVALTTASTQCSSSKESLRILQLTDGVKGARNANIILNADGVRAFTSLFIADSEMVSAE